MILFIVSQMFFTGSADVQYWRWRKPDDERFQSIFDLTAYWESWEIGGKFLYLQPSRAMTQPKYEDLAQKYATYNSDKVSLKAGSYYASFGRGLVLAGIKDDQLMLDRWLEGGDVVARWGPLEGEFLSGTKREIYYYDFKKDTDHTLRAGRLSLVGIPHLELTGAYARINYPQYDSTYKQEFTSGAVDVKFPLMSAYGELVKREGFYGPAYYSGDSTPDTSTYSYYAALSFGLPRFNILLESKDYNLLANGFNNPPPINLYGVYLTDTLDEAGHGLTASANPIEGLTLTGHRSLSTKPSSSRRVEENYFLGSYRRTGAFRITAKMDYLLIDSVLHEIYNDTLEPMVEKRTEIAPGAELVIYFLKEASLTISYDHRMRTDLYHRYQDTLLIPDTLDYADRKLKIGLAWAPVGSLWWTYSDRRTSEGLSMGVWRAWEASVHLNEHLDAMVFYGSQPAGVLCSGGICRTEPKFDGLKLWLIGRF
jgi:hypothetical protein